MIIKSLHTTPIVKLVDQIASTLLNGGVVLVPTETVYGLITLEGYKKGINKINKMKDRVSSKHYQVLINSLKMAKQLGAKFSQDALKLAEQLWPGGLTLVVGTNTSENIGLRYPNHQLIQTIINKIEKPLVATSANKSGQPPLTNVEDITTYFGEFCPDLVIDAGTITGRPSTVVDCSQGKTTILREGVITTSQVKEIVQHA